MRTVREALSEAVLETRVTWPGGGRVWRLAGDAGGLSCNFVKRFRLTLPDAARLRAAAAEERYSLNGGAGRDYGGRGDESSLGQGSRQEGWPLRIELDLEWGSPRQSAGNHYESWITASS